MIIGYHFHMIIQYHLLLYQYVAIVFQNFISVGERYRDTAHKKSETTPSEESETDPTANLRLDSRAIFKLVGVVQCRKRCTSACADRELPFAWFQRPSLEPKLAYKRSTGQSRPYSSTALQATTGLSKIEGGKTAHNIPLNSFESFESWHSRLAPRSSISSILWRLVELRTKIFQDL